MITRLIIAGVFLLLILGGCASGPQVGSRAPEFTAADSQGNDVSLATFQDQVLILDFWAVW